MPQVRNFSEGASPKRVLAAPPWREAQAVLANGTRFFAGAGEWTRGRGNDMIGHRHRGAERPDRHEPLLDQHQKAARAERRLGVRSL